VQQGAVRVNERRIEDPNEAIRPQDGDIVQVGTRKFAKIRLV
jgi:tyrosyl-tRNA synthetase